MDVQRKANKVNDANIIATTWFAFTESRVSNTLKTIVSQHRVLQGQEQHSLSKERGPEGRTFSKRAYATGLN